MQFPHHSSQSNLETKLSRVLCRLEWTKLTFCYFLTGFLYFASLFIVLSNCSREDTPEKDSVVLFAAVSTEGVFEKILKDYCKKDKCLSSYASSATLAKQIHKGAYLKRHSKNQRLSDVDLFISANPLWIDYLIDKGLVVKQSRIALFSNKIVLASNRKASHLLRTSASSKVLLALKSKERVRPIQKSLIRHVLLNGISKSDCIVVADPSYTPLGFYTKKLFAKLDLELFSRSRASVSTKSNFGENLGLTLGANLESKFRFASNARHALYLLERGECELGIVYKSDARRTSKVDIIYPFPDYLQLPIYYELVMLITNKNQALKKRVKQIYTRLTQKDALEHYRKFHFSAL